MTPLSEALDSLRDEWARQRGLKQSKKRPFCVCRLLDKRCSHYGASSCPNSPPETDHPSLWCRDGKAHTFVSQPYQLLDPERLDRFCRERGLKCTITTWPAWHYPGAVLHVEITKEERR